MSKTKITLSEEQADDLARLIEEGVRSAMKEYVDQRLAEETEPIYIHLGELYQTMGEISTNGRQVAEIVKQHIEGATNAPTPHTITIEADGSRDFYGGS